MHAMQDVDLISAQVYTRARDASCVNNMPARNANVPALITSVLAAMQAMWDIAT
jgi:hypothetical protein